MSTRELKRGLAAWAADGLITDEQALSIRRFEVIEPAQGTREIPMLAEILGYIGGALAIGAVGGLVANLWDLLGVPGRIALPAAAAIVALVAAWFLGRRPSPSARRLEQFLLVAGLVGVGVTGGVTFNEIAKLAGGISLTAAGADEVFNVTTDWAGIFGFGVGTLAGLIAWTRRKGAFVVTATAISSVMMVMMSMNLLDIVLRVQQFEYAWLPGALAAIVGAVWLALGLTGVIHPENPALAVGSVAMILGIGMMRVGGPEGSTGEWSSLLGIAVATAMVLGSVWLRRYILLGVGAVGMMFFSIQTVIMNYREQILAPITLLALGAILIAAAGYMQWQEARTKTPAEKPMATAGA